MNASLAGAKVLVTRPVGQQATLMAAIEAAGGRALHLPALTIHPHAQTESLLRLRHAAAYDWLIFISRNAVEHALSVLPRQGLPRLIAIGNATAAAIRAAGLNVALHPERFDSEGLLARLPHDMSGQRVLIVRGVGGREQLAAGLAARGASVEYAEVYRRGCPESLAADLQRVLAEGIDIVTTTSGDVLQNLLQMAGEQRERLLQLPLVVMSQRGAELAQAAGFTHTPIYVAPQASDAGIVSALRAWHNEQES